MRISISGIPRGTQIYHIPLVSPGEPRDRSIDTLYTFLEVLVVYNVFKWFWGPQGNPETRITDTLLMFLGIRSGYNVLKLFRGPQGNPAIRELQIFPDCFRDDIPKKRSC
jgi:hypothetical protein